MTEPTKPTETKKEKTVKIQAIRDCKLENGKTLSIGQEAEVSEADAAMFCDTKYATNYDGFGEGSYKKIELTRAKRL